MRLGMLSVSAESLSWFPDRLRDVRVVNVAKLLDILPWRPLLERSISVIWVSTHSTPSQVPSQGKLPVQEDKIVLPLVKPALKSSNA